MENHTNIKVVIDRDLEELIPGFIENRKTDMIKLKDALEKEDFEYIRVTGHSMKGYGAGYGFERISLIGKVLEYAAKEENSSEISEQINQLAYYIEHVEISFA